MTVGALPRQWPMTAARLPGKLTEAQDIFEEVMARELSELGDAEEGAARGARAARRGVGRGPGRGGVVAAYAQTGYYLA